MACTTPFARRWICLILLLQFAISGCSSDRVKTYPTEGIVKFEDGELVKSGIIELESIEHGTTATGRIRPDGTFELGTYESTDGAAAGKHRVIVVQVIVNDGFTKHTLDHGKAVPEKYHTYERSGLTADVEPKESNQLEITLSAK